MQTSSHFESTASSMIDEHGPKASQRVVDQIVAAIRDGDMVRAKRWEMVGQAIDRQLTA